MNRTFFTGRNPSSEHPSPAAHAGLVGCGVAGTAAVPDDGYLSALLEKPHFIALAAFQGAKVVGGLTVYVLDKYERARAEAYIYDLAVAEPHRRKGVARSLIRTLKPIAKKKGA